MFYFKRTTECNKIITNGENSPPKKMATKRKIHTVVRDTTTLNSDFQNRLMFSNLSELLLNHPIVQNYQHNKERSIVPYQIKQLTKETTLQDPDLPTAEEPIVTSIKEHCRKLIFDITTRKEFGSKVMIYNVHT